MRTQTKRNETKPKAVGIVIVFFAQHITALKFFSISQLRCHLNFLKRSFEIRKVLCGVIFPIGSVRLTAPHRRLFALFTTARHRTVGHTIQLNRTVRFKTSKHRIKPHVALWHLKTAPNRTLEYIIATNSTVGFPISENRTKPHRKIPHFLTLHRAAP